MFRPGTNWRNRFRTPILVAGTCGTVTLAPGEEMLGDRSVRFGTVESLGGAVAYFGTTRGASQVSRYRSACYRGLFHGLFADSLTELGPATVRGRRWLDSLYQSQTRYQEWTLIGDPCLRVWTGPPLQRTVVHAVWVSTGQQEFVVGVRSGGGPVVNAGVCVWLDSAVYDLDTTDSAGSAVFSISPNHPGRMRVAVTGRNLVPYEGICEVHVTGSPFVVYLRHQVLDSFPAGNSDGMVGAGETIAVPVWLRNLGDSCARGVEARLRCADSNVVLLDSVRGLGTLLPHDSAWTGRDGFRFRVLPSCPDGRELGFRVHASDSAGREWDSDFRETVVTVALSFVGDTVRDSSGNRNGRLDPNETADLIVTLRNTGSACAKQTTALLRSSDPRLEVLDSVGTWGDIPGLGTRSNNADRFTLHAAEMVPSTPILCTLVVSSLCYSKRMLFTISPGVLSQTDPCCDGPRIPASYWAYDDVDSNYEQHPEFEWIEARGTGTNLHLRDNHTVQIDLPPEFGPFYYYGRRYMQLSVCSNGWIAPGVTSFIGWENYRLPRGLEPPVLAVCWDDLVPDTSRNVWWLFDSARHRLVIEWDSVAYRSPAGRRDEFEVVFYDTTLVAADGSSVFDFQYRTAGNFGYSTVGIQDPTDTVGITVVHNGSYSRAAARVLGRRCIRFMAGQPTIGLAEAPAPTPGRAAPAATIVRGVLWLPRDTTEFGLANSDCVPRRDMPVLLDVTGRKGADLKAGSNDIRHLPPGVYFVRMADGDGRMASSKVVVTR
ncbi:hypothetical protein FJY71_03615 [candidate division WOR-3 bacterium]|nr:hypothetical protein [candidate division WOR-3 bacterium]